MNLEKDKTREISFVYRKITIFSLIIMLAFFWSCDSSDNDFPSLPNEPQDTTGVVIDTMPVNAPSIQTPSPVIHLADNLDEQDQLGWCIDTRGNGFNEELHTHSCKASGGDVQFIYDEDTRQICSYEFTGFCIEMSGGPVEGMSLILVESDTDSPDQKFIYNASGEFVPEENTNLCLAAGETSGVAGIYMFRTLTLELSSETDVNLKRWVIVE